MDDIGPCLPPHLLKKGKGSDVSEEIAQTTPRLPPSLAEQQSCSGVCSEGDEADDDLYGPALPPHLSNNAKSQAKSGPIGPSLPKGIDNSSISTEAFRDTRAKYDSSSDDDIGPTIGPMPPSSSNTSDLYHSNLQRDFEARSNAMKDKILGKNKPKQKREEWMTELPPEISKNFGLGARTFRRKAVDCGDRSGWTDSPSERAKKEDGTYSSKRSSDEISTQKAPWEEEKERNMGTLIESYTKQNRGESLMEQHQKKIKKQKKEEGVKPDERRPFDRDIDLANPMIDPAKRKSLIKKSQELDTRFQRGKSGSAYL